MTDIELFDTAAVRDDAEHWDVFASRVAAEARKRATVLQWLAGSRGAAVAMGLVVGAVAILLLVTEAVQDEGSVREQWAPLLAPSDAVGRTLATENQPPSVGRLFDDARGNRR